MHGGRLRLAAVVLPLAVFVFVGVGLFRSASNGLVGHPAPGFSLPAIAGRDTVGLSEHAGRYLVINFWASWCIPCKQEAPVLAEAARRYAGRVDFIGIDVLDGRDDATRFLAAYRHSYPEAFDGTARTALRSYVVTGVPETFFVDPAGTIVGHYIGAFRGNDLHVAVDRFLMLSPGKVLEFSGRGEQVAVR